MISLDLSPIYDFLSLPADVFLLRLIILFGWIPICVIILFSIKEIWMHYINIKWGSEQKFTLLAIDIPRGNAQSPKAVENIFTYLAGAQQSLNLIEKYWIGKFQLSFSLEIVGIDGYTQFLIYTPVIFRDLVESAIYSQYPDAEITEVNDYTQEAPKRFPDEEYDIWGAEFIQVKSPAYPIKLYEEFIHLFGEPEEQFKDPMASLMDLYSSLKSGEQIWFQIIITPIDFSWTAMSDGEVGKILGEKKKADGLIDKTIKLLTDSLWSMGEIIYKTGATEVKKKEDESLKMFNLKPKERKQIESIQLKSAKVGFGSKMRFIYLSKKEIMNKPKALNGFVGYMKQFAALDLNNLKPDTKVTGTSAQYFFTGLRLKWKKNKIMSYYVSRDGFSGKSPGILNIEELATIWHFPVEAVVKAPLIQKTPGRKAEPPMSLPLVEEGASNEEIFSRPAKARGIRPRPDQFSQDAPEEGDRKLKTVEYGRRDNGLADDIFGEPEEKPVKKEPPNVKGSPPENLPVS
ncbi:MAG: hypothetical protein V1867_04450 [Candidatus Falkowbacteria bacterium]